METQERGPGRYRVTHVPSGAAYEDDSNDLRRSCELNRIWLADRLHTDPGLTKAYEQSNKMNITDRLAEFKFERVPCDR